MKITRSYLKKVIKEEIEKLGETDSFTPLPGERDTYAGAGDYTEVEALGYVADGKGGSMWTFVHNGKKFNVKETAPHNIDLSTVPSGVEKEDIETAIADYRVKRRSR